MSVVCSPATPFQGTLHLLDQYDITRGGGRVSGTITKTVETPVQFFPEKTITGWHGTMSPLDFEAQSADRGVTFRLDTEDGLSIMVMVTDIQWEDIRRVGKMKFQSRGAPLRLPERPQL